MCSYKINFIYAFNDQQTRIKLNKAMIMLESTDDNFNKQCFIHVLNLLTLLIYYF